MDSAIATRQDSHTPRQPCVIKVGASQGRASQWPCHGNRAPRKNHARGNHAHSELDADITQLSIKLERMNPALAAASRLPGTTERRAQVAQKPGIDPADSNFQRASHTVRHPDVARPDGRRHSVLRSEAHTSELQSLLRIS